MKSIGRLLLLAFILFFQNGFASANAPSHIALSWSEDPQTTQTITWKTDIATVGGQVQYWQLTPGNPASVQLADAQTESVESNWGPFMLHTAVLKNLAPGTQHAYRVGNGEEWSAVSTFTTADRQTKPFRFLIFGDSQSVNYDTWAGTLHQAYQAHPSAAFFINMGDLIDCGADYGQWYDWFNAAAGVIDHIPCMPLVGNHETYAVPNGFSRPSLFTIQFKVPQNGPEGLRGQTYSFDYGNVHFVMLDTQRGEERSFAPDMLERQAAWLAADLANVTQKWTLIFLHRPLYNHRGSANAVVKEAFLPIIDQYHVDAVFSAHDHTYARSYPFYDGQLQSEGQPGTVHVATGRSGSKTYADSKAREEDVFFYNPQEEPNYLLVEAKEESLIVRVYHASGGLLDEWRLEKTAQAVVLSPAL